MLDPATDVDLVTGASVSVANVSGCQCLWLPLPQLPVSLSASISCQYLSCWYLCIICQCLGCVYLNCRCLCLSCRCLLVPWLVSRFCAMVAKDITKPVPEDSCETIVEDTHESSAQMSCRPSQFQILITSNNNRSGYT